MILIVVLGLAVLALVLLTTRSRLAVEEQDDEGLQGAQRHKETERGEQAAERGKETERGERGRRIVVVTPTVVRLTQRADLTRLCHVRLVNEMAQEMVDTRIVVSFSREQRMGG